MGVALGAVAEDRDGLALEGLEGRVVLVDHRASWSSALSQWQPAADGAWRRRRASLHAGRSSAPAQQLPRRGPRKLVDEVDLLRDLVRRESPARMIDQVPAAGSAPGRPRRRRRRPSPPLPVVRAPDDRGVGDAGMRRKRRPRPRCGRTFSPPVTIRSLAAALDPQVALVVDPPEVAGVQPAVRRERARSDGRAADEDLAVLDRDLIREQRPSGRPRVRSASAGASVPT